MKIDFEKVAKIYLYLRELGKMLTYEDAKIDKAIIQNIVAILVDKVPELNAEEYRLLRRMLASEETKRHISCRLNGECV